MRKKQMITLLSPAKKLNLEIPKSGLNTTQPIFKLDTIELTKVVKKQSVDDLKKLMHLSDNLARLNADRFKAFNLDGLSNSSKAAGLTFDGNVYWGLQANSLNEDDLNYAQSHLRILSGLYGILKPLDLIQPYRLEMGTKLKTKRGKSLYEFWGNKIATSINNDLSGHLDKTIVNLASNEYFKAIDKSVLKSDVISAKFLNIRDGQAKSLMYYAKFARGLMARWIIENKIEFARDLKEFDLDGYKYDNNLSENNELVFTRIQPETKK